MHRPVAPSISHWYQDRDRNAIFKVIAKDFSEDFVEIQYFSGEIEELDLDSWFSLNLRPIPAPEDSSGPFELSQEDLGYDSEGKQPENWSSALSDLDNNRKYENADKYEKQDSYLDSFHNKEEDD